VVLHCPFHYMLMSSITEWSISAHLTIAHFEISAFRYVESDRSISCENPLTLTITEWTNLRVTARAPVVLFTSVKINVSWIYTSIRWHRGGSISAFFIRSALHQGNNLLIREICNIFHWNTISWSWWSQNNGRWSVNISLVGFSFLKSWSIFINLKYYYT